MCLWRLAILVALSMLLWARPGGAQEGSKTPPASLVPAVVTEATALVQRLEAATAGAERQWTSRFVGRLKRKGIERPADEVLRVARDVRRDTGQLRTDLAAVPLGIERGALDAGAAVDRLVAVARQAVTLRFSLALEETRHAVDLSRQRYDAAVEEARRRHPLASERAEYTRLEGEARARATKEIHTAAASLRTARDQAFADFSAWSASAARLGRQDAAADTVAELDARLNVAGAPKPGAPEPASTALDRFFDEQDVLFAGAIEENGRSPRQGMAEEFTAFDVAWAGKPSAKALRLVRQGPAGLEPLPGDELRFGQPFQVEASYEQDPGGQAQTAEFVWPTRPGAGRFSATLNRESPTLYRSDPLVPDQGRMGADLPPPAGDAGTPGALAFSSGPSADAERQQTIDALRAQLTARERLTQASIAPFGSPREVAAVLRHHRRLTNGMREKLILPDPAVAGQVSQTVKVFEQRWGDLVVPILSGRRPDAPVPAARWKDLAKGFEGDRCKQAAVDGKPEVALDGGRWACVTDAFLRELVDLELRVEGRMDAHRQRLTQPLERAMQDAERRFEELRAQRAAPTLWLRDMTWRLNAVWLEGARLRIQELEHIQAAAAKANPAFRWLLSLSPGTGSGRPGPTPIPVPPGSPVRVRLGAVEKEVRVESAASAGPALTRELYASHHAHRNVEAGVDRRLDAEIELYEGQLESRDITAGDADLNDPARSERRRQAVAQERQRRLMEELPKARAEIERERQRLNAAIEAQAR